MTERLPVVDLADLLKTPPQPTKVRRRAGCLLRRIQNGEVLTMPDSRPLPSIGNGVNELRLTDLNTEWRIIYRIDPDALIAVDVFLKKTQKTPQRVIVLCIKRLQNDDAFNSKP